MHLPGNLQLPLFQEEQMGRCRVYGAGHLPFAIERSAPVENGSDSAVLSRDLGRTAATAHSVET